MPIYEYECSGCGRFEAVQKVSEEPLNRDPDCKRADCPCTAQRVMSATSFHLKGSGWYKTDYTSTGSKTTSTTSSPTETKSDSAPSEGGGSEKKALKTTGSCGTGCGCH